MSNVSLSASQKMVVFRVCTLSSNCRLLRGLLQLPLTFCSLAKWRISKHKCSILHKSSIEELNLNLALNPPFCQTAVTCCVVFGYTFSITNLTILSLRCCISSFVQVGLSAVIFWISLCCSK